MTESPPLRAEQLLTFATAALAEAGMPPEDARLTADSLVQADLWGHGSHGVMRTPWYVARLRSGVMTAVTSPELVVGAGAVAVRNSNHFGMAMYFSLLAPPEGCIMFLTTNASPAMAPWGGRDSLVGTNPWSWASPAGRYPPMVLDIANTGVARGKIYLAKQSGEPIPSNWALNSRGESTTDPVEALAGHILPMGGHKGYAISVMMDVLAGVLTGSAFGADVAGPQQAKTRSGVGHLFIALNIEKFEPLSVFNARMETLIEGLKAAKPARNGEEIFYPGEIEARNADRHRLAGLVLPRDTLKDLTDLARELQIEASLPF